MTIETQKLKLAAAAILEMKLWDKKYKNVEEPSKIYNTYSSLILEILSPESVSTCNKPLLAYHSTLNLMLSLRSYLPKVEGTEGEKEKLRDSIEKDYEKIRKLTILKT